MKSTYHRKQSLEKNEIETAMTPVSLINRNLQKSTFIKNEK